jgi:putative toxin-antitoxin system antitoxin component (TIGR02293 family)
VAQYDIAIMAHVASAPRDVARFIESMNDLPGQYDYAMLLGMKDADWSELIAKIERGFPYSALEHLQRNTGLAADVFLRWIQIAPRTQARRKLQGRLPPDESDRLLRVARVYARTLEMFHGDRAGAVEWLLHKLPALGGKTPVEVSRTDLGAREVEQLIGRIRHGVFS